ncbi:unnamed protein product [Camellia sinensis]
MKLIMPRQNRVVEGLILGSCKIRKRGCSSSSSSSSSFVLQNYRFKRAILVGKPRGSISSTPVPSWRTTAAALDSPKYAPSQSGGGRSRPVSARNLVATLWEMNEVPLTRPVSAKPSMAKAYNMRNAGAVIHSHGMESCLVTMINPLAKEFRITHMEMIKGIQWHGYYDELVVPIIENTAHEWELTDSLAEAVLKLIQKQQLCWFGTMAYIYGGILGSVLKPRVDKLKKKLRHEENVHRALERAFTRPWEPYLVFLLICFHLLLLAEVTVLEEEVVRLEEQVVHFRQGLYQEAVYISFSNRNLESSADLYDPYPIKNSKLKQSKFSVQTEGSSATSTLGHLPSLPDDGRGKENQTCSNSSKNKWSLNLKIQTIKTPVKRPPIEDRPPERVFNNNELSGKIPSTLGLLQTLEIFCTCLSYHWFLSNKCEGIGTGWSSYISNYNPSFKSFCLFFSTGGVTYCAVASLRYSGFIEDDVLSKGASSSIINVPLLLDWSLQRLAANGGFQGRPNKPSDTCYAFWVGGVLRILGGHKFIDEKALRQFLLTLPFPAYLLDLPEIHWWGKPSLDWNKRMHIALGAAHGLLYLHEQCNPRIIHRDVKAANILLDERFEAVVGDFGLAKLLDLRDSHVTTAVRGTVEHIAPEYLSTGRSSEKTDVFGFGILLLELVTGQKALDAENGQIQKGMILDWVRTLYAEKRLEVLVDRDLKGCVSAEELEKAVEVALHCTQLTIIKYVTILMKECYLI